MATLVPRQRLAPTVTEGPFDWALDSLAFEDWFNGQDEEPNPRIEMVRDIIDDMPEPHRTTLEEYFYERISMRDIARRHELGNPWFAHKRVHDALDAFKDAWIERHGEL